MREQLQQEADRASFERRALAVEQERGISENELQNRIELAIREEQLVTQTGANEQRRVADEAEASRIRVAAEAEAVEVRGRAKAATVLDIGSAQAEAQRLKVEAHVDADTKVLLALALGELAGGLPEIGTLVVSPDLLSPLLTRLMAPDDGTALAAGPGAASPARDPKPNGDRRGEGER